VITGRRKLLGTPVGIGFSLVTVSLDHQVRDTPDVEFGVSRWNGKKTR
jgi:hypothetical protein